MKDILFTLAVLTAFASAKAVEYNLTLREARVRLARAAAQLSHQAKAS